MLQFGHAQRAWDDVPISSFPEGLACQLQFGHAQRAWDDTPANVVVPCIEISFNSATPRGRGMTVAVLAMMIGVMSLQFGHAQRAWDDP